MDFKPSLQIGAIVKTELWHNLFPYCILSLGLLLLTPLLFGTSELDRAAAAIPLEYFLSLLGLFLLTPIFLPEKDDRIYQVVRSRSTDYCALCLLRLGLGLLLLCLSVFSFTFYLSSCGSQVTAAMLSSLAAWGPSPTAYLKTRRGGICSPSFTTCSALPVEITWATSTCSQWQMATCKVNGGFLPPGSFSFCLAFLQRNTQRGGNGRSPHKRNAQIIKKQRLKGRCFYHFQAKKQVSPSSMSMGDRQTKKPVVLCEDLYRLLTYGRCPGYYPLAAHRGNHPRRC